MKLFLKNQIFVSLLKKNGFYFARNAPKEPNILNMFTEHPPKQSNKQRTENGRSWKPQQLRLKSNEDLHKLWYTCVREKNVIIADDAIAKKGMQYERGATRQKLDKINKTMSRVLTVVEQRQKIRAQFRQQLEDEYIQNKKQELQNSLKQKQQAPQITPEILRAKYHQLRKGIDNVQYLEHIWNKKEETQRRRSAMQARLSEPTEPFESYFKKQLQLNDKPLQEQILRAHVKNWRSLNLKQRRVVLGILNARRAKDAKSEFLKELRILGHKVAAQNATDRI